MHEKDISILEILTYGHPVLKKKAEEIKNIDDDIAINAINVERKVMKCVG